MSSTLFLNCWNIFVTGLSNITVFLQLLQLSKANPQMVNITRRRNMHCTNNQKPSPPSSTTTATTKFRYVWPVRIRTRTLNDHEHIIYNVSPIFTTVANSIAFSWTLRLCSEYTPATGSTTVNVFLYYLDGARDTVAVRSASISLVDSSARRVLIGPMRIDQQEWRKGSGWSTEENHRGDRERFSECVLGRVGKSGVLRLAVDIEIDARAFDLFEYFPTLSRASVESSVVDCAEALIREIRSHNADAEEKDPFVVHRNVLAFGCKRLQEMQQRRKDGEQLSADEKQALQTVRLLEWFIWRFIFTNISQFNEINYAILYFRCLPLSTLTMWC